MKNISTKREHKLGLIGLAIITINLMVLLPITANYATEIGTIVSVTDVNTGYVKAVTQNSGTISINAVIQYFNPLHITLTVGMQVLMDYDITGMFPVANIISLYIAPTLTLITAATAGPNGTINPLGAVSVNYGENQTFTITPSTGYIVTDVLVDGVSVGAVTSYTFSNVTADHTISATFKISSSGMKLAAKDLLIPYLTDSNKKVRKAAKKAIKHIGKSLEPKLWADVNHLTKKGKKVFEEEKHAVKDLIKNDKEKDDDKKSKDKSFTPPFSTDVLSAINYLLTADKNLAQTAIDDAVAAGGKTKEIDKANKEMAKALAEIVKNKYAKAIDHYNKAWEHAQKAVKGKDDDEDDDKDDESIANNNENISIDNTSSIPVDFSLSQNYPNPFNPSTVIQFGIPEAGFYTLNVYNTLGQEVARLVNGQLASGNYRVNFDASKLSTGIYIYSIRGNNVNISKKMILIK